MAIRTEPKRAFASVKLDARFAAWLRRLAARRGCFIYQLVEELAEHACSGRPWREPTRRKTHGG
mgnify:CR=1 FL=1